MGLANLIRSPSRREVSALLAPEERDLPELPKRQAAGLVAMEDRLDDVRGQEGEAEQAAHVGAVHAEVSREFGDGRVAAGVQEVPPVVRADQGDDERLVGG